MDMIYEYAYVYAYICITAEGKICLKIGHGSNENTRQKDYCKQYNLKKQGKILTWTYGSKESAHFVEKRVQKEIVITYPQLEMGSAKELYWTKNDDSETVIANLQKCLQTVSDKYGDIGQLTPNKQLTDNDIDKIIKQGPLPKNRNSAISNPDKLVEIFIKKVFRYFRDGRKKKEYYNKFGIERPLLKILDIDGRGGEIAKKLHESKYCGMLNLDICCASRSHKLECYEYGRTLDEFITMRIENLVNRYDLLIGNPPFSGEGAQTYFNFLYKMCKIVKPGRWVAIILPYRWRVSLINYTKANLDYIRENMMIREIYMYGEFVNADTSVDIVILQKTKDNKKTKIRYEDGEIENKHMVFCDSIILNKNNKFLKPVLAENVAEGIQNARVSKDSSIKKAMLFMKQYGKLLYIIPQERNLNTHIIDRKKLIKLDKESRKTFVLGIPPEKWFIEFRKSNLGKLFIVSLSERELFKSRGLLATASTYLPLSFDKLKANWERLNKEVTNSPELMKQIKDVK